jgi:plasmid stabilization system protein ParE
VTGYEFHPEALVDIDEIWEFIAADSVDAADRVIAELLEAVGAVVAFPGRGHKRRSLLHGLCGFL